jgi:hypothetical protein
MALKRRARKRPTEKSRLLETEKILTLKCPVCFQMLEITYDKKYPFKQLEVEKCFTTTGEHHILARCTQKRNRGYRIRLPSGCRRYKIVD